jgi:carbonic anhydrase/acetyltransferase-like protein (isoleucine patch superfamily)
MVAMGLIRAFGPHRPRLGGEVFVADTACVIGDVELADGVSVWYGAVLRGDVGKIRVGARSNIQDNATLHMSHGLSHALLGEEVTVGHNAVIHGARIGDRALVGMGAVVLDNAEIGEGAWVAAASIVPPGAVVPAHSLFVKGKVSRELRPEEREWAKGAIERYLNLARAHAAEAARELMESGRTRP